MFDIDAASLVSGVIWTTYGRVGGPTSLFTNGRLLWTFFLLVIAILQFSSIIQTLSDNVADLYARGPAVQVAIVTTLDFVP